VVVVVHQQLAVHDLAVVGEPLVVAGRRPSVDA
jgi:hypothetical protein